MKKYEVNVGKEIGLSADVIEAQRLQEREKTRTQLAIWLSAGCATALVLAAFHGFISGDFGSVKTVWSFVALPLGSLVTHYFGERRRNEENH